jgi:hypothetical protein
VVIAGSLLLILVAVAMLGLGLVRGSNAFLVGSIAASLLAAVALVVSARRAAAARTTVARDAYDGIAEDDPTVLRSSRRAERPPHREGGRRRTEGTVYGREGGAEPAVAVLDDLPDLDDESELEERVTIPSQSEARHPDAELELDDDGDDEDPPDEPAAQIVAPADAARVARMSAQVLVIDGRPRYHQAGCVHLLGRESEPLPVSEAAELGFTPCSLCEPDSALLADARRV